MDDKSIEIKGEENSIKDSLKKIKDFVLQKKFLSILIIVLFLVVLFAGTSVRTQNLHLLKDSTTEEYIPLALDPFYFLRLSETILDNGSLPEYDAMRYPSLKIEFNEEILPRAIVFLYKIAHPFNKNITIQFIDVLSPVIFFFLGLILFFFLILKLTKSKPIALLSSAFLAFVPTYLYRTMAGFADHESIGMFAFFILMIVYLFALKYFDKEKISLKNSVLFGLLVAFASTFTVVSWSGIANFTFMIIPLSFLIFWLLKFKESGKESFMRGLILFYSIWVLFSVLFGIVFQFSLSLILNKFILSSSGLISLFVLGFIISDYFLIKKMDKFKFMKKKFRQFYSIIITIIAGSILLLLKGENVFSLIASIWDKLIHPFGLGRVGLTVAENAQPYLVDWISQTGKILFWMFVLGSVYIGIEIAKNLQTKKERNYFVFFWILMISGILFSRVSSSSLLNGTNFISQAFYMLSLILFVWYIAKTYFKKEIKIKPELIIIASWMFFMMISGRSAVRFFFALTPFACFAASFFVVKTFDYFKKSKDDLLKMLLIILFVLAVVGSMYSLVGSYKSTKYQAQNTGPSANYQWQNAMSWVRDNTPTDSVFLHWWDYGYWVQYLGQRVTITDGGHGNGFWDHLIGRYVLTTPYPETALSFMKAQEVDYLLMDQTDVGKYPAYSKIGGDENDDRFSMIPVITSDPSQIQETSTGKRRLYQGGFGVDEDILINQDGNEIFLPGPTYDEIGNPSYKSYLGGIILEVNNDGTIKQPQGVFIYNGNQISLPLRYIYYRGEALDFKTGVEAVFYILPKIYESNQGINFDEIGSGIYLSPKVSKSLFAQLYLMDDVFNKYPSLTLVYSEPDIITIGLKSQGIDFGEAVDYYGFRGPIKIWKVEDNPNIIAREEFLRLYGEYAEFDGLQFTK